MAAKSMRKVARVETKTKVVDEAPSEKEKVETNVVLEGKPVVHTITCICCGRAKYDNYFYTIERL